MTHIYILGKFETSTRRGKVTVDGNTIYCSIDNFRRYANATHFYAYKHDENVQVNNIQPVVTSSYTRYVKANGGLNVRNKANGSKIGALANGTRVNVYETLGNWSKVDQGWVCSDYLVSSILNTKRTIKGYTTGTYKVNCSKLNVRTGPSTKYRIKGLKELTNSARKQGGYVRGVKFTINKVINNWGRSPSGYVCLDYCKKI